MGFALCKPGDYPGFAPALRTDRYIDIEHTLQALHPGHGLMSLIGRLFVLGRIAASFPAFGGNDFRSMFTIGTVRRPGEHPVKSGQVHSRFGNQCDQFGGEVERLEDDMGGSVTILFTAGRES